ncbi:Inner membrane protein involved in colicin E2 resistance [Rubellimicrobium thermophilum DSM 16684]|uniref:Inner membrane protein involved in colicin E2 resistance n=1 Tax=Rubellimicrobium thermophilum DSM 16684 TaxID=1123069 RepID=S9R6P6_9RHOB|nr:cell envelope integrity protein CreD [Rubellimicrobium thermophilum]EPX87562.1 Inner membrane protein involved in colicin E2 resistance [Rubellimicrobium thermophilum DSM 16684]
MPSAGARFLIVGLLTLLMAVPLFLAGAVVLDRANTAESTRDALGREWGGPQTLAGPVLLVPVEGPVTRIESQPPADPVAGAPAAEPVVVAARGPAEPVLLMPERLDLSATLSTETRRRGLFAVPVFVADVAVSAAFDPSRVEAALAPGERALWDEAVLRFGLGANAGLRGETVMEADGVVLPLEPYGPPGPASATSRPEGGIEAAIGAAARDLAEVRLSLRLNGAQEMQVAPVGRVSAVRLSGDWPDPSFAGAFLPDSRTVSAQGFEAEWTIPHLARALPQVMRGQGQPLAAERFGVTLIEVNDFYQKAWRAARYNILFIALTFLTVLLIEKRDRPTHPVQYLLIGLAQALFVLLMVAYAERIGFTPAYLLAAGATVALLVLFGATALRLGLRTLVLLAALLALYAVLYLILRSADLALLAGTTLAFGALAVTMVLTRNETWWGQGGRWGLRAPAAEPPPLPHPPDASPPAAR